MCKQGLLFQLIDLNKTAKNRIIILPLTSLICLLMKHQTITLKYTIHLTPLRFHWLYARHKNKIDKDKELNILSDK